MEDKSKSNEGLRNIVTASQEDFDGLSEVFSNSIASVISKQPLSKSVGRPLSVCVCAEAGLLSIIAEMFEENPNSSVVNLRSGSGSLDFSSGRVVVVADSVTQGEEFISQPSEFDLDSSRMPREQPVVLVAPPTGGGFDRFENIPAQAGAYNTGVEFDVYCACNSLDSVASRYPSPPYFESASDVEISSISTDVPELSEEATSELNVMWRCAVDEDTKLTAKHVSTIELLSRLAALVSGANRVSLSMLRDVEMEIAGADAVVNRIEGFPADMRTEPDIREKVEVVLRELREDGLLDRDSEIDMRLLSDEMELKYGITGRSEIESGLEKLMKTGTVIEPEAGSYKYVGE